MRGTGWDKAILGGTKHHELEWAPDFRRGAQNPHARLGGQTGACCASFRTRQGFGSIRTETAATAASFKGVHAKPRKRPLGWRAHVPARHVLTRHNLEDLS